MHLHPKKEAIAGVLTNVANTMLGLCFTAIGELPAPKGVFRTASLPIPGEKPVMVAVSSDENGCLAVCSAMFSCRPDEVDQGMINDSLCEIVNMTAGGIKSILALDQALGLPKIVSGETLKEWNGSLHIQMRTPTNVELVLSIMT